MKLIEILSLCLLKWATIASLIHSTTGLNKTKRTLVDTATYGEKPAPIFYALPDGNRPDFFASTKTFALAKPPLSTVFDPEVPKQVAAQQVLYEYQQTPTNAVSNVHVKQLFQPLEINDAIATSQNNQNGQIVQLPQQHQQNYQNVNNNAHTSETIVNPVHHSTLVNHGQNYAHVQLQPYFPQHSQTQHYVPGRYYYVNGKYSYPPLLPQNHYPAQTQSQFQNINTPQQSHKPSLSYVAYGNPKTLLRQKLTPPPTGAPMNYNKFTPPHKQDIQQITKPVNLSPKVHEEVEEDEEVENSSLEKEDNKHEENNEEDEDEKSSYEEEIDENDDHFGRYHEDDDEDLGSYKENHEEEDEEDDSERKASKVVRVHNPPNKNRKNNPNKKSHNDKNNYAWSESYSHSSRYENGKKKGDKVKESKKYDSNKKKGGKRKNKSNKGADRIEGRYSQKVPVVQEHKLFREKWYLSKSNDEKQL